MEVLVIGLAASAASTFVLNSRVRQTKPEMANAPALADVVHSAVPAIPLWIPELLLVASALLFWTAPADGKSDRLFALGIAFFARAITIHLTLLPTPVPRDAYCHGYDLWVSGHTLAFCAFATAAPALAVVGSLSLIASRQHYSIDVVGAVLLYNAALGLGRPAAMLI